MKGHEANCRTDNLNMFRLGKKQEERADTWRHTGGR